MYFRKDPRAGDTSPRRVLCEKLASVLGRENVGVQTINKYFDEHEMRGRSEYHISMYVSTIMRCIREI